MNIAVVILNWNGRDLLERYLPSVVEYSKNEAKIYVVDNASTDDSIAFVKKTYPEISCILLKENGGFARGYNQAIPQIPESICVLLNSDVAVSKNWLQPFKVAFKNPKIVAAQPKILDDTHRDSFEYAGAGGGFIDALGYPYCRGRIFDTLEKDKGQFNDTTEIFWATGACLAVKKEAFLDVQGFDETFFTHQEEIDLCWRLQAKGGTILYCGNSTVYHLGGGTLAATNPRKTYFNFRNSLLMLLKNVKGNKVFFILLMRMKLDGIAALRFLMQMKWSHFIAVFKAHIHFYGKIPMYISKRKKTKKLATYSSINSIVWQYFVRNKRFYSSLHKK